MLRINGLAVFTAGDSAKKPIIFVHGFPFDHYMWEEQVKYLSENYFCISYDIRGLGQSEPGDGQYTMESFVDDLFEICDSLTLHSPVLCGLSMGGYIVLRAAERDLKRFGGLILCDTKAGIDDNHTKLQRASSIKRINSEGIHGFVHDMLPGLFAPETLDEKKDMYSAIMKRSESYWPVGVKGSLIAMLGRTDSENFLKMIDVPVLVLVGSFDTKATPEQMRLMHEKIKNSDFAVAPRSGHLPPLENPGFVNEVIEGFLKKNV